MASTNPSLPSTNPSLPSTKEISNYAWLCYLLVNVGSCVLRGIFDRVCPPQNLYTVLTDPLNHAALQTLRKRRVLSNTQWGKLYPAFKSSVSSRDFDSSLLLLLLRNIFGVTFPASGWNNIPPELDTSPEADITRLKFFREIVYSYASVGSVDNPTFSLYWSNIKDAFLHIGGTSYADVINDLALHCIDADLEEHYRELLREWLKDEECIAGKLHEGKTVKKARKEEDMEGAIDISEQNLGLAETEIKCAENRSAGKANVSLPKLSIKLPKMSDLPDTSSPWINVELPVDILLLAVEDCEFLSCFVYLKEPFKSYHNSIGYVYFGCMGDSQGKKMKIALMRCSKGSDVPGGSLSAAKDAISLLRPKATFSVGACRGLNSGEVKLGDVVVSAKLITAAHTTPPSRDIGKLIRHLADGWKAPLQNADEYNAKVHCDGVFLSISEANKDIIGQHPEAIAVEMEGGGVFAAAHDFKTEWVVVKGIKDFVNDGQSSSEKWKQIACVMAASVVANILNDAAIFQDWPHSEAGTSESHKPGLPEKPSITNAESEADKDFTVTWSEAEANSIKYRVEWRKQPMTRSTELFYKENIEENYHKITGLEYDAEYEVKLFAVNKQGDSEPDIRAIKTKGVVSVYTTKLKTCIVDQTESQPKLFASHTISNMKTDEVFTNLRIIRGKEPPVGNSRTNTRSKNLEYYLTDSGTLVEHRKEIFLGTSDAPKNPNSILVVGKAGIGKSLFCQKVVRDWAKNQLFETHENRQMPNFKFVYLVTFRCLNALKNNYVTLREFLDRSSALSGICIDDVIFEYIVNHPEEVLIILDGFDEYSQKDYIAEKSAEEYLNDAKSKMPVAAFCSKLIGGQILKGSVVVVTTRPEKMNQLGRFSFEQSVVIVGFSSEQVKEYIKKYFKGNEERKNALLKHVMNNENLVSFAHIPMLCFLLCFEMEYTLTESENPYDLPVSTTDIYTKLIGIFELKHCAKSQYRQNPIPEKFKYPPVIKDTLEKLSELAATLLLQSKPTFDESEIEGSLEVEEVEELIGSGLLYCGKSFRPDSSDKFTKNFSFTHLTVQEFLAARWFVKENRIPGEECSDMVYQFMAGILSTEGNEELMVKLMEKLTDSRLVLTYRMIKCLSEYQDKGFAKRFIRNHPQMFRAVGCDLYFDRFSDVDIMAFSFVLDIISELNEEGVVAAEKLVFNQSQHTMSGIKRVCGSLNNEHCPVSELELSESNVTDEWVDVVKELVVSKLTKLNLYSNEITDAGVASLCEVLQKPSCKLTTLSLVDNKITDAGVASLCVALQHPSCKLTTLSLGGSEIANTGVASLCEALQHPNCKLTTLVVVRCKITDTCIATLCKALQQRSCKLTTLNLGDNMITDTGIASLRAALQHPSCKVASLILGGNKITSTGVSGLCKALQHQSCKLTTLHLGSNEITDPGVASLCEALQDPSCKLTTLVLPESINHECRENLQAITQKHRPALDLSFSHWEYDLF